MRGGFIKGDESEGIEEVASLIRGGDPPGINQEDPGPVGRLSLGPLPGWAIVVVLGVIAGIGLIVAGIIAWVGFGLRKVGYAGQVYGKMTRLARLAGHGPKPTETPREFAFNLAVAMDAVEGNIERIGEAYAAGSYRPGPMSERDREAVGQAWERASKAAVHLVHKAKTDRLERERFCCNVTYEGFWRENL